LTAVEKPVTGNHKSKNIIKDNETKRRYNTSEETL
jgi:hypothetical protein